MLNAFFARSLTVALGLLAVVASVGSSAQTTVPVTVSCTESTLGNGNKQMNCSLGSITLIAPSNAALPPGAQTTSTLDISGGGSASIVCNPSATSVATSTPAASTLTANCTTVPATAVYTWSTTSNLFSINSATSANASTTVISMPASSASLPISLRVCPSSDVGTTPPCVTYDRAINNPESIAAPAGCQITGVPAGAVVQPSAAVSLGYSSCTGTNANTTYTFLFNSSAVTMPHVPFPSGSTSTTGTYVLRVCNGTACTSFPSANGLTVTKASTSGDDFSSCPNGTGRLYATTTFDDVTTWQLYDATGFGTNPIVIKFTVPGPKPGTTEPASIAWNSNNGVGGVAKRVVLSNVKPCDPNGQLLGSRFDTGQVALPYTTGAATPPYITPGTWYLTVTSPSCTTAQTPRCNARIQIWR